MMLIISTVLPFIFIIYYVILISRTKYIFSDLKSGEICYSCKEKIEVDQNEVFQNLIDNKTNYQICPSCKRDEKLDEIVNYSFLSKINSFKLYLIGDGYNRLFKKLIIILIILLIIDILLKVNDIKWFSYLYNFYLFSYWIFIIYRHKLISIKKT